MKIIRPYGRSVVQEGSSKERKIIAAKNTAAKSIEDLLREDKLVIALWIGIIDKIIVKAFREDKRGKQFKESRALQDAQKYRRWLGDAAWEFMKVDYLLSVFEEKTDKTEEDRAKRAKEEEFLRALWNSKIEAVQKGKVKRDDFPKGRWYESFVSVPIEKFSPSLAESVVGRINSHFEEYARKIIPGEQERYPQRRNSKGILKNYENAISHNTLQNAHNKAVVSVDEAMWETYSKAAGKDLAALIKDKILQEQSKSGDKEKAYNSAVEVLRKEVWPRVFGNARTYGAALNLEDGARLLIVHNAVKDAYKRLLRGRSFFVEKQKPLVSGQSDWQEKISALVIQKLEQILPSDNGALFRLIAYKERNRDINRLIRMGKIIHYTAAKKDKGSVPPEGEVADSWDKVAFIVKAANWPTETEIENSKYWTSHGQTEIKQNEAFVRVWRRAIAFAAHNLKDWADPENNIKGDILMNRKDVLCKFDEERSARKYNLLFADAVSEKYRKEGVDQKALMCFALDYVYALRNAVFHFKGLGTFVEVLQKEKKEKVQEYLEERYVKHQKERQERLKDNLENIQIGSYLGEKDINRLWYEMAAENPSLLPLPRLRRVLERAEKAWKGGKQGKTLDGKTIAVDGKNLMPEICLPDYVSAQDREKNDAANCQWTVLKLLYDGAFKTWLDKLSYDKLQNYIDCAVNRATWAAKTLNQKEGSAFIVAKSDKLEAKMDALKDGDTIETFFYNLTAETASEMRVQRGYDSDGKQAQLQAKYIEDLKCDVVALAFVDYLKFEGCQGKGNLTFILDIGTKKKTENPFDVKKMLSGNIDEVTPLSWQATLYFLLHLIPVDEVSNLRQQIRKYQIVAQKSETLGAVRDKYKVHLQHGDEREIARQLVKVLDLYIFMHDAQFVGNEKTSIAFSEEDKKIFYLNLSDWNKVFEKSTKTKGESAAHRDLRELWRFGGFELLKEQKFSPIKSEIVTKWEKLKIQVEGKGGLQDQLQELHDDWKERRKEPQWQPAYKDKKTGKLMPDGEQYAEYNELLQKVSGEYRHLNNQVMLQDHLRLHRLLMAVLGRLVDFSGLFERDLYFTMLALLYKKYTALGEEEKRNFGPAKSKPCWLKTQFNEADKESKDCHGEVISPDDKHGIDFLKDGRIIDALLKIIDKNVKEKIFSLFNLKGVDASYVEENGQKRKLSLAEGDDLLKGKDSLQWIRNRFAHLALLEKQNMPINLTREVNYARQLMSYDRKLKNAVSKSITELLAREKLNLAWEMCVCIESGLHNLSKVTLESEKDYHLKKTKTSKSKVFVDHYGKFYVDMVRNLFKPA